MNDAWTPTVMLEVTRAERDAILAGLRLLQLFNDNRLANTSEREDIARIRDDSGDGLRENSVIDQIIDEVNK